MRYWMVAFGLLAVAAAILPLGRVTHTIIGTAQLVCALGLGFLLVWLVWDATRRGDAPPAAAPAPRDVPAPD
jgi:uncharacterized membrane protein YtjA (UPF0391 family)